MVPWNIHPATLAVWCREVVTMNAPMQVHVWVDSLRSTVRRAGERG